MDLAAIKTVDKKEEQRFVLALGENPAFIDYKIGKSGAIYLLHTQVPEQYERKGVGHKLVRETLNIIEEAQIKIIPLCPFIRSFLKNNLDDYKHLLAEGAKL